MNDTVKEAFQAWLGEALEEHLEIRVDYAMPSDPECDTQEITVSFMGKDVAKATL